MPHISEFYGIVITMYWREHGEPHFHARYGERRAVIRIADSQILSGRLPPTATRMVKKWSALHRGELQANWDRLRRHEMPLLIAPLP